MDETLTLLLDKFADVAKGGPGIVMVVTPVGDDSSHVVAICRGSYSPEQVDEICVELKGLVVGATPSPFV